MTSRSPDYADWSAAAARALGVPPDEDDAARAVDRGVLVRPLHADAPATAHTTRGTAAVPAPPVTMPHHAARHPDALADDVAADARGGVADFWIDSPADGPLQTPADVARLREAAGGRGARLALDAGADALAAAVLAAAASSPAPLAFADPAAVLAATGSLPRSLAALDREAVALARDGAPARAVLLVSSHPYHLAGAGPAQEIGFALAAGVRQLRALTAGGVPPAEAAARIGFSVSVGRELFPEIAKLRALRTAWAHVLAAHGVSAGPARLHAVASRRTLTVRDPWVNLLRVAGQTFAAVCGGADVVTPAALDEADRAPGELGRRIARNTLPILLEECFAGDVADPAGGSYLVETLTDALAREAWRVLGEIEREGGLVATLESGWAHDTLAAAWERHAAELDSGAARITGVTAFADPDETPLPAAPTRPAAAPAAAGTSPWSAARSDRLRAAPSEIIDALVAAARDGARLADLAAGLTALDDAAPPSVAPLPRHRDAAPFETAAATAPGAAS